MAAKKVCVVSRNEWAKGQPEADAVAKLIADQIDLGSKDFSTGSFGYHGNGKLTVKVGNKSVSLQCSVLATVVDSKVAE